MMGSMGRDDENALRGSGASLRRRNSPAKELHGQTASIAD
jgi:hypothetical protein